MRFKMLGAAALIAFALAGCSSPDDASTPSTQHSATAAPTFVQAIVDTKASGCAAEEKQKPGNCWLPLYANPTFNSRVINLHDAKDSTCRMPGVNGAPNDSQLQCWPQPGTRLAVDCQKVDSDGVLWYAVKVPDDKILDPMARPGDRGWAKAQFLYVDTPTAINNC